MNKVVVALVLSMGLIVVGAGCESKAPDAKPADTKAAATGAAPAAKAAPAGDSIGVPECDQYMTKFKACIDKVPGPAKAGMQQAYDANKDMWKQLAAEPATKATLAGTCKSSLDALAANPACK